MTMPCVVVTFLTLSHFYSDRLRHCLPTCLPATCLLLFCLFPTTTTLPPPFPPFSTSPTCHLSLPSLYSACLAFACHPCLLLLLLNDGDVVVVCWMDRVGVGVGLGLMQDRTGRTGLTVQHQQHAAAACTQPPAPCCASSDSDTAVRQEIL